MRKPVSLKQKLHRVMSQLQTETEDGHVNTGAQVRIAKHLKSAFEAHDKRKDWCIQEYLIDCFVDDPFGAMSVPSEHRHLMEDPNFLRKLIHTKRKRDGVPIENKWWDDFMEGYLPVWMFNDPDDLVLRCIARTCTVLALSTRWHVLEPIERRLNKLGIAPHELFPVCDMRPPTLFPTGPESEEEFGLDVWHALETEPRFLRWLLKPDAEYSEDERERLQERAFDQGDKASTRDERFLHALGLRGMLDHLYATIHRLIGKSFAESRALVLDRLPDPS
jgi:hypothetical protein